MVEVEFKEVIVSSKGVIDFLIYIGVYVLEGWYLKVILENGFLYG